MARQLSFFYRRRALSGEIRRQVAERLGAKVNPDGGVSDDISILVKTLPGSLARDRAVSVCDWYLDFIDHSTAMGWLSHHPEVKVIVCSKSGEAWLKAHVTNPLTFIPQHHCNVERQRRPDRPIKTVGYIGLMTGLPDWYDWVNAAVRKMGLEMRYFTNFRTRQDVVDAYLQTDIQFQWCEGMPEKLAHLKNPMRVINGLSFGIPMVANQLPAYQAECAGQCVLAPSLEDAMDAIAQLATDAARYGWFTQYGPDIAEPYHLDEVAQMFRRLADA